jgi:hypothetical protein
MNTEKLMSVRRRLMATILCLSLLAVPLVAFAGKADGLGGYKFKVDDQGGGGVDRDVSGGSGNIGLADPSASEYRVTVRGSTLAESAQSLDQWINRILVMLWATR